MRQENRHGVSLQHRPGPAAVISRRNSKSKGAEVGLRVAFVEKWQEGRCDWDRMREEERDRRSG